MHGIPRKYVLPTHGSKTICVDGCPVHALVKIVFVSGKIPDGVKHDENAEQKTDENATATLLQSDLENLSEQTQDKLHQWFEKSASNFADSHSQPPLDLPPEEVLSERPPSPTGTCLTSVSQRIPTYQFGN